MNGDLSIGALTYRKNKKIWRAIKEKKKYKIRTYLFEDVEDNEEFQGMVKKWSKIKKNLYKFHNY